MLDVRANFSRKYRLTGTECPACKQANNDQSKEPPQESQEHIEKDCSAFNDIRNQYDLLDDHQLVLFFQEALAKRDQWREHEDTDDTD